MKQSVGKLMERLKELHPVEETWSLSLDEAEVRRTLLEHRAEPMLFGRIPRERLMADLESHGILDRLRARGYSDFEARLEGETPFDHVFRLYARHPRASQPCLLVDVRTHQGELAGVCPWTGQECRIRALVWEWVSFQDPMGSFTARHPRLPGQEYPGLGIFRQATRLMLTYVRELDVEALVNLPEHFHNAVLYSTLYRFFSPGREGRFQALVRDLLPLGLARASWGLVEGRVRDYGSDQPVRWETAEQVYPLQGPLTGYFRDPRYLDAVEAEREAHRYSLLE
ncbi:MAG TPA: hypothetical protein VNO81_02460 [Candidatus Nitrosotenuis sp.]|jgi:hypothetical protein|nr:hypothetical protein [Candidatus Nitrosotenuis sp.]